MAAVHWGFALLAIVRIIDEAHADDAFKVSLLLLVIYNFLCVYEFSLVIIRERHQLFLHLLFEECNLVFNQILLVAHFHYWLLLRKFELLTYGFISFDFRLFLKLLEKVLRFRFAAFQHISLLLLFFFMRAGRSAPAILLARRLLIFFGSEDAHWMQGWTFRRCASNRFL